MKILYYYPRRKHLSLKDLYRLKRDKTYIGGAEISTIKYIHHLRMNGHLVDYNTPTQEYYDAIMFIWKPFDIDIKAKKRLVRPVNPSNTKDAVEEMSKILDGLTCPSDYLIKEYSGLGVKTFKHPLGISQYFMPKNVPPRDHNSFCYANVVHPRKGTDIVLEAFYLALKENRDLKLHLYGNEHLWGTKRKNLPEFYEKVEEYTHKIPKKNLINHGNIPHITLLREFAKYRAHLVPSRIETGSSSTLEAQAMGTPTLVLNKCSLPEYCGNGGIILSESVDEWTIAILDIASNDNLWAHLTHNARCRIKDWSFEKSTKILEEIIKSDNEIKHN